MFQKYNLQNVRITSSWENFPYNETTLDEFWSEATYRLREGVFISALSGELFRMYCCYFNIEVNFN